MKFRPLGDRVVVRRIKEDQKTAGGIIIPDTVAPEPAVAIPAAPPAASRRRASRAAAPPVSVPQKGTARQPPADKPRPSVPTSPAPLAPAAVAAPAPEPAAATALEPVPPAAAAPAPGSSQWKDGTYLGWGSAPRRHPGVGRDRGRADRVGDHRPVPDPLLLLVDRRAAAAGRRAAEPERGLRVRRHAEHQRLLLRGRRRPEEGEVIRTVAPG